MSTKPKSESIKLPPNDNDAEEAVLGSLLIDGGAIHQIVDFLKVEDFYFDNNRIMYKACLDIYGKGEAINQVTLARKLTDAGKIEEVGSSASLGYLISVCPTSLDIEHYANIVHQLSVMRQLIVAGDRISALGYDAKCDDVDALENAERILHSISGVKGQSEVFDPEERSQYAYDHYTKLKDALNTIVVPTGFYDVDKVLGGGMYPGEAVILAGDTGLGKSTIAHDITNYVADNHGAVVYLSSEMGVIEYTDKEISKIKGISPTTIRFGRYNDSDYSEIVNALGQIGTRPIFFGRINPFTVEGIRRHAQRVAFENEIKLIIVDNINDIELASGNENVYRRIGEAMQGIRDVGVKLNVPVLVLAQLGSDLERRQNKRPTATDIYESKRIRQIASVIMLLYRIDKYWNADAWNREYRNEPKRRDNGWEGYGYEKMGGGFPANIAEINIVKQRVDDGKNTTKVRLIRWNKEYHRYENLARE